MGIFRRSWQWAWTRHTALVFYLALMAVLLVGVEIEAGAAYLPVNLHYLFLLLFFYVLAHAALHEPTTQLARTLQQKNWLQTARPWVTRGIDVVALLFPFLYFASVGYVPFVRMMFMDDYYAASGLRQNFFDALPTWANYGGEYFLRGLAPVWLVYCFIHRRRIYFPALLLTSAQALGVITKASIVILLFPLLVVQLARRAWRHAALSTALIVAGLMLNVTVLHQSALTQLAKTEAQKSFEQKQKIRIQAERAAFEEHPSAITQFLESQFDATDSRHAIIEQYKALELASEGIWIRLFAVQGRIVKQWLDTYPDERGFQHGCGYRWFAPFVPCAFENLPRAVWEKYFAELRDIYHLTGTVSAPHYINAYANFGDTGVLLAAIGMAGLLAALAGLFPNPVHNLAFNASFLGLALQAPLFSLLNSSGWALTIILYLVFFPRERIALNLSQGRGENHA